MQVEHYNMIDVLDKQSLRDMVALTSGAIAAPMPVPTKVSTPRAPKKKAVAKAPPKSLAAKKVPAKKAASPVKKSKIVKKRNLAAAKRARPAYVSAKK